MNYWYDQDETQKHYAEPKQTLQNYVKLYGVLGQSYASF